MSTSNTTSSTGGSGVVVRATSDLSYGYSIVFAYTSSEVVIAPLSSTCGVTTSTAGVSFATGVDVEYTLGVNVDGERITVYVDGVWIMDYETSTLCASGSVGLITTYANGYFGNITVLNGTYTHDPFYNV